MRIRLGVWHIPSPNGLEPTVQLFVDAIFQCKFPYIDKNIRFLADTGACHTTILDHDAKRLGVNYNDLELRLENAWARGVGGPVPTYGMKEVVLKFLSQDRRSVIHERKLDEINVLRHPKEIYAQIREMPSLLGMDFLRSYRLFVSPTTDEAYIEGD